MAIDLSRETLLTLGEAARHLPRRRLGRQVSCSTLWRWHARGVRCATGRIHLDALKLPSGIVTSVEALQRFCDALSAACPAAPEEQMAPATPPPSDAAVEQALDARGV